MYEAAGLAGYFAAHAVWCVSAGGPLIPLLAFETEEGQKHVTRFADEELAVGVALGRQWLDSNHGRGVRAVLIYDGYITLPTGKTDALFIDARDYTQHRLSFQMVVPYRDRDTPEGFAVFRPKFVSFPGAAGEGEYEDVARAFFDGVDKHSEGAKVWNAHINQDR